MDLSPNEMWYRQDSERKLHWMLSKLGLQIWENTWFSEYDWGDDPEAWEMP